VIAFVSATLLPMGSEPAVFGYAKLNPDQFWLVVAVATAGNTLGGAVDYWMGRGASAAVASGRNHRFLGWFERLGPKALLVSFLPAIGDPKSVVAGWQRAPSEPDTVLDLAAASWHPFHATDAISAGQADQVAPALRRMERAGSLPTGTLGALYELMGDAAHPAFREVLALAKMVVKG
jgi:membrane protein DedA with SNARE-associated domain